MQEQQAELYQKLEQFLKASMQCSDPPIPTNPASPSPVPPKSRKVRPSVPTEFDGDHSKGIAFLNSCQTYIRLCPEDFVDEQTKIIWAMSYMKSGRAQKWTACIFCWEQQHYKKSWKVGWHCSTWHPQTLLGCPRSVRRLWKPRRIFRTMTSDPYTLVVCLQPVLCFTCR